MIILLKKSTKLAELEQVLVKGEKAGRRRAKALLPFLVKEKERREPLLPLLVKEKKGESPSSSPEKEKGS